MDATILKTIILKIEKENEIFSNKGSLDSLSYNPKKIIGRQTESEQLLRYLIDYKKGFTVPFVSVYGRSGSGKSTLVRYVCQQLTKEIHLCFVNLRKTKSIFGATNIILSKLGQENVSNSCGTNAAIKKIGDVIQESLVNSKKKLLVLVLDEFDVLFFDKRNHPSDFVYKLVEMVGVIRKKGFQCCIITISNNILFDFDLDDRVRSRIGGAEIFFMPYATKDVLQILKERSKDAFNIKPDDAVLQYCAQRSSTEHGDARRAIDLLRIAAEIASSRGQTISTKHIDLASDELQKDRIENVIFSSPLHFKFLLMALAIRTYGLNEKWHSTSSLYAKYEKLISGGLKPLKYRRISENLKELENTGIVECDTRSKGRFGFGSEYCLCLSPQIVGKTIFPDWWEEIEKRKKHEEKEIEEIKSTKRGSKEPTLHKFRQKLLEESKNYWK